MKVKRARAAVKRVTKRELKDFRRRLRLPVEGAAVMAEIDPRTWARWEQSDKGRRSARVMARVTALLERWDGREVL